MQQYTPGDPHMIDTVIGELKSKGVFDQFRRDCIADVDTKVSSSNLLLFILHLEKYYYLIVIV